MNLVVVGISHRSMPVELRERFVIPADELPGLCQDFVSNESVSEAVILSTCNRVEVYLACTESFHIPAATQLARRQFSAPNKGIYTYVGKDAVNHLFRVSSSLDSLIVGEAQILGQVKEAYEVAFTAGTMGPVLQAVFSRAFRAAKRIRTHTDIARSAVSIGHVAVELARQIFGDLAGVSALLVGAGKMGVLAARHLSQHGAKKVLVANRTFDKGRALALKHGWSSSSTDDIPLLLQAVDVVICSTGSPDPILTYEIVRAAVRKRRYRPLFLIDIAVPRDIESRCSEIEDVYLYNIDDLEGVSRTNAEGRLEAAERADTMLRQELVAFEQWQRERAAAPTIQKLREKQLETARREAERALKRLPELDDDAQLVVHKLAEVMVSRMLHGPMTMLKRNAGTPRGEELSTVVREMFALEDEDD
jgi:glutamyl-tRNA reductase